MSSPGDQGSLFDAPAPKVPAPPPVEHFTAPVIVGQRHSSLCAKCSPDHYRAVDHIALVSGKQQCASCGHVSLRAWWSRACPTCKAEPGAPCKPVRDPANPYNSIHGTRTA